MKKVTYFIELEIDKNGKWYNVHKEHRLSEAYKTYHHYRKNVKGNRVMDEMQARMRIRKVTEEVLIEQDAF